MNCSPFSGSAPLSLGAYDSQRFGPLFAVSDEGSAAEAVTSAALTSAKARALGPIDPLSLGLALDGERMTSAGEVPIGPDEYLALQTATTDKLLCTTNVGVRVNARLTQQLPEFPLLETSTSDPKFLGSITSAFAPFLNTPDGKPRPLTVRLTVAPNGPLAHLKATVAQLEAARSEGKIGPRGIHRLTLLVLFRDEITSDGQIAAIERALSAAADAGLDEVAIDGELRDTARRHLGVQSLLNILAIQHLQRLFRAAQSCGVRLTYRYQIDIESAARTIWTGLHTARAHGFAAGKYGLLPLTLEEQHRTIELITRWTRGWSAIPAFYVDTPLLTSTEVFDESRCEEAAKAWLKMARGAGAEIVLFDSPDRVTPRRLLRTPGLALDTGVLDFEAVDRLLDYATQLGISILWSGGITSHQAFELAKRKVSGIFSTSSTAAKIAVTAQFESDPRLPSENEPTEFGVRRIHAIVQGGFLTRALSRHNAELARSIDALATTLVEAETDSGRAGTALHELDRALIQGWRIVSGLQQEVRTPTGALAQPLPVPANSVRVFRGTRLAALDRNTFINKLETVFMPMTIQMQRLYGLSAYLPAIFPVSAELGLPDELALVFYRTQDSYHEAKRCVGGRAYSALHELVFDMRASGSDFPQLFDGEVRADTPYHLFDRSVDWQSGTPRLFLGKRLDEVPPEEFLQKVGSLAARTQQAPGSLDAAIFCANPNWVAWWEHFPESPSYQFTALAEITRPVFASPGRRLRMQSSLTVPYNGLTLGAQGDFVNFYFPRE